MMPARRRKHGRRGEASCDWLAELSDELERSRRYERPFLLIRVPLGSSPRGNHQDGYGLLRSAVRYVDRCWSTAGSVYLLLPEATREMGEGLLMRLREAFPELRLDEARAACFPEDALTAGALLDAVRRPVSADVHTPALPAKSLAPVPAPAELPRLRDAVSGG